MKTKQQILSEHGQSWFDDCDMEDETSFIAWEDALKAMEQYAAQFQNRLSFKEIRADILDILYEANGTGSGIDDIMEYLKKVLK